MLPDDTLAEGVERLLMRLKQVGLPATVLYLDKGFCCGEIIAYLQHTQQAAILACPIRVFCRGRGSFSTDGASAQLAQTDPSGAAL